MPTKKDKDELEDVETIPREQAEKEMREAVKHVREEKKPGGKEKHAKGGSSAKDELEDVETIPREQAEKEMREAASKVKKEDRKKATHK
ncbi:hypothetical protein EPA93_25720 [Ktedonosporobacter rubrisoli]|uniref:Uncharacterized protein n=1 Tax=Ktedonosporobacter rubrisoli TaxID=2509675 RepID=A0A4P6JV13_KTERU|nr:hypothetical protein [Ktedonosporobacter rubrisoli]QBD79193.1 hypothetical protein EPA93_25720 [Ktedonosporobacter rubrisoli]